MADKKISALTAASTPLAGTEVLPIVQSGATVKVAVSDLTAGRAVSALSLTTATVQATNSSGLALKNSGGTTQLSVGAGGGNNITLGVATSITDNIIQGTATKGVNFTANTPLAGMTSQLLNWYEEGTYVATLTPGTSGTIPLNSSFDTLSYTKVGRVVTVVGQIQTLNPALPIGSTFALNLPFTPVDLPELAGRGGTVINYELTAVTATWEEGSANLYIWKDAATVLTAQNLFLSFTYFAA